MHRSSLFVTSDGFIRVSDRTGSHHRHSAATAFGSLSADFYRQVSEHRGDQLKICLVMSLRNRVQDLQPVVVVVCLCHYIFP